MSILKSSITERFLAYKAKPKADPLPPPPPPKVYDFVGFISPQETTLERMGRMVDAIARGDLLSPENKLFFIRHRFLGNKFKHFSARQGELTQLKQHDRQYVDVQTNTCPLFRG